MGRPISPAKIGSAVGKLKIKFHDGTSVVEGYVVKQTGVTAFVVTVDGNTTYKVKLAQTTGDATSLVAGMATIEAAADAGGAISYIKKLDHNQGYTTAGTTIVFSTSTSKTHTLPARAAATSAITIANPGNKTNGTPFAVTGTYTGTAPSKLQYRINTGAYVTATSPTISGGTYSFNVTLTTQSSITLQVRDFSNNVAGVVSTATASFNVV